MIKSTKNKLVFILISVFCVALALALSFGASAGYAASNVNEEYADEFSGKEFSSEWTNSGAELNTEYHALSLIEWNTWGPSVNLAKHKIEKNSAITFDVNFKSGQWLGVAFGLAKPITRFNYAESALILYNNTNGTRLMQRDGSQLSSSTMNKSPTYGNAFKGTNVTTTVKIEIASDGKITVYSGLSGGDLKLVATFTSGFAEGYLGFSAMGNTSVDFYSFKYEKDGVTVYSDDFTESKLGYNSTGIGENDWYVSSKYEKDNAKLGAFGNVKMSAGDSFKYNKRIYDNGKSENSYKAEFLLKIDDLDEFAVIGAGITKSADAELSNGEFFGFGKYSDYYFLARYKNGKVADVKESYTAAEFKKLTADAFTVSFTGKYGNRMQVEFLGNVYLFEGVDTDGYFAIGALSLGGESETRLTADDFRIERSSSNYSSSEDMGINFEGTSSETVDYGDGETETYYDYYINKNEWYVGSGVTSPVYNDKNLQYHVTFTSATDGSVFIPKQEYGETIIRFDVKTVKGHANGTKYARFGVSFGLPSIYFSPSYGSYFFFQDQIDGTEWSTILGCGNMDVVSYEKGSHSGTYGKCAYDVWGDNENVYNVMLVAEDGNVKVYFKKASEDESQMQILRAEFTNANIYGYVAFYGNTGATFQLENFSVTNINPYKTEKEPFAGYTAKGAGLSNGKYLLNGLNGDSLVLKEKLNNSLTFARVVAEESSKLNFSFNGQTLTLGKNDVTSSADLTVDENTFDFSALKSGANLRIEVFGDKFSLGVRSEGSESELYLPVITGTIAEGKKTDEEISFGASGGNVTVESLFTVSLESKIKIEKEDYDALKEAAYNKLVVKPELKKGGSALTVILIVIGAAAVGAVVAAVLILRKRRAKK